MEYIELIEPQKKYADEICELRKSEKTCCEVGTTVPSNTYLAVRKNDDKVVGVIDLRHHINHPILGTWGGHCGYSVHLSERGKGYAKEVEVIYSSRKSIAIQIKPDGRVILRAPYGTSQRELDHVLDEKNTWIEKHLQELKERKKQQKKVMQLSTQEIKDLVNKALEYIPERVEYYATIVGVDYSRITIRNQKTRWGSCSGKGSLNFNCLLMLMPPEVIDYVVVHELCHRKEMNHSKAFWNEVEKVLSDYKVAKNWLKENGEEVMRRMYP